MGPKAYLVTAFILAFLVMAVVPVWFVLGAVGEEGGHQHGGGAVVSTEWFVAKVQQQQEKYGLPDGSVRLPPGSKVYIMARQFAYAPRTVRLVFGGNYEFIFFSTDVYHGASMIQSGSSNSLLPPNMTATVSIRATQLGEIQLLCNEYCGPGHHLMTGTIIVE